MKQKIFVTIEASGCLTKCAHCWVQGGKKFEMPVKDVELILSNLNSTCSSLDIDFNTGYMNDILNHSKATELIDIYCKYVTEEKYTENFKRIPTPGISIATRSDWKELLYHIKELGTEELIFTFHGIKSDHDKLVSRKNAFQESILAIERVRSLGFRCRANIMINKINIYYIQDLITQLRDIGIAEFYIEVANYYPTKRLRDYQSLRPDFDDLLPYQDILYRNCQQEDDDKEKWRDLEKLTESHYYKITPVEFDKYLNNKNMKRRVSIVCDIDLNLYFGSSNTHCNYIGNLRKDNCQIIIKTALDKNPNEEYSKYFSIKSEPDINSIATEYGDKNGKTIYMNFGEMWYRWLDLALVKYRKH